MVEVTTVGPLAYETRDDLREFKDDHELQNYDAAVRALLEVADHADPAAKEVTLRE